MAARCPTSSTRLLAALETNEAADLQAATGPLRTNPNLRQTLLAMHQRSEIVIDSVSLDAVKEAGFDSEASEKTAADGGGFPAVYRREQG